MFQANRVGFESSLWAPIDNVSELHSTVVAWMRVKAANTIWNGFSASGFWIPFLAGSWIPKAGFWILDSIAQYSGFYEQKFPGFRNPDYLTWGELSATTQSRKIKFPRSQILEECINSFLLRLFYLHLSRVVSQMRDSLLLPNGEVPETFLHDGVIVFL